MAEEGGFDPARFGAEFQRFLAWTAQQAAVEESEFARRLREHFGEDPAQFPVLTESVATYDHPNLQVAIDGWFAAPHRSAELIGIDAQARFMGAGFSLLLRSSRALGPFMWPGPVEYANFRLGRDSIECVEAGLFLARDGDVPFAFLVYRGQQRTPQAPPLSLEVLSRDRRQAAAFLSEIRAAMVERNVYRGRTISLSGGQAEPVHVEIHEFSPPSRDEIVLPPGVLERIELHTIEFAARAEALRKTGRALKRGLLLHGPPGTGKTLTALYLAGALEGRTTILLTGQALTLIEPSCQIARALEPAMVVLEDVDLVAEHRTHMGFGPTSLLFQLLNQIDGLNEDADVIFLMTSNRPDLLEPALASRPGRVDQAIELPTPDAQCRRRLIELFARGLDLRLKDLERVVSRTEGGSAALIRELMRKAALLAASDGRPGPVDDEHLDQALTELLDRGGPLTGTLLGMRTAQSA